MVRRISLLDLSQTTSDSAIMQILDAVREVLVLPSTLPIFINPLKSINAGIATGSVEQSDLRPRKLACWS
jgi:hypothetical protein